LALQEAKWAKIGQTWPKNQEWGQHNLAIKAHGVPSDFLGEKNADGMFWVIGTSVVGFWWHFASSA